MQSIWTKNSFFLLEPTKNIFYKLGLNDMMKLKANSKIAINQNIGDRMYEPENIC